ncbi:hypothetical protein L6Q85_09800 [bacterium]|nr:hypothetical protein [bacterium]
MMAEPDIANSKKPVIPGSDRESSNFACEWIPAFAGMTNFSNEPCDPVGNVLAIYNANSTGRGNELYYFTQDAFGIELTTSPFSGTVWSTARTAGITEHQAGKWIDPFTGLYFFHARWYDSGVGRFVGKDPIPQIGLELNHASKHFSSCSMLCYKRIHSFTYKDRTFRFSDYSYVHNCPTMFIDPDGNIAIVIGAGVVVYIVGSFLNAINCEAILKKLVNCVEWRLKRPLSNHEIMLLSGDIISNNLICKCLPFSTTLMDHVRNHITYPDLQPIGCTNETADQILYYYGWK